MNNFIIYGKTGQLSQCICAIAKEFDFNPIIIGRFEAQIDDLQKFELIFEKYKPLFFINCSAYNDVEGAEREINIANKVNSIGPQIMARCANLFNVPFFHISTDYVFGSNNNKPYKETETTCPLNAYGKSKLDGEQNVINAAKKHIILRTSWIFSEYGNNFLKNILNKAQKSTSAIEMDSVQINCPTYGIDLARIILSMAQKILTNPNNNDLYGVFHATSNDEVSRFEYAKYIMDKAKENGLKSVDIIANLNSFNAGSAKRPIYSVLDSTKLYEIYGLKIPNWRIGIIEAIKKLYLLNIKEKN